MVVNTLVNTRTDRLSSNARRCANAGVRHSARRHNPRISHTKTSVAMPLVQQVAVLVNDAQFRCHIASFATGMFNIAFSVILPYSIAPFTFFLPSIAAWSIFRPVKRLVEDRVLPLIMLPLSVVAGLYFLLAPLHGENEYDPELDLTLRTKPLVKTIEQHQLISKRAHEDEVDVIVSGSQKEGLCQDEAIEYGKDDDEPVDEALEAGEEVWDEDNGEQASESANNSALYQPE